MAFPKKYLLRTHLSLRYITANVVDRQRGMVVASASTVEECINKQMRCGRTANEKAAAIVGEVLAMRLKVEGLDQGEGHGIHADVNKEIARKGFVIQAKIWALVNALKDNGIKLILESEDSGRSFPLKDNGIKLILESEDSGRSFPFSHRR